jgi:2-polyprenyl-3-methyl-5-hydroxy-6-metoxy-1,4-benzoquinol methylase
MWRPDGQPSSFLRTMNAFQSGSVVVSLAAPCCSMAFMATEVDPAGVEPRAILQATDFRNTRVLEVGAGDGRLTFRYAEAPTSVVGIDTNEQEIRLTAEVTRAELRGHVQFLCASATALPFSHEQFEIVLLASSL